MSGSELTELKYEENGVKISLKKTKEEVQIRQFVTADQAVPSVLAAAPANAVQTANAAVVNAVQTANTAVVNAAETAQDGAAEAGNAGRLESVGGKVVKSPLVGTFYAAPSEDADAFVREGDSVKEGQVLAIVEAMKLMNEIESDFSGTVSEVLVENGEAVEYGQPLFIIK